MTSTPQFRQAVLESMAKLGPSTLKEIGEDLSMNDTTVWAAMDVLIKVGHAVKIGKGGDAKYAVKSDPRIDQVAAAG